MIVAKPMPKAGWQLATTKGTYAKSYDYYGTPVAEGVTEIAWTGGNLPDDWYDEFVFRARLTDFPRRAPWSTSRSCRNAPTGPSHRWIEIPEAGKIADDYEEPAPGVTIIADAGELGQAGGGRCRRPTAMLARSPRRLRACSPAC